MKRKAYKNKGILCVCLAASLMLGGCAIRVDNTAIESEAVAQETAAEELTHQDLIPTPENVNLLGRTCIYKDMLWLVDAGTGAEFSFYGTKASITLQGDGTALKIGADKNAQARVAIYVNGERVVDDMMREQVQTYDVVDANEAAEYVVRIVKLSEPAHSSLAVKGISVDAVGGITPTATKDLYIEFIGDSITCGYGVDDEVKEHHFSTTTEDVTKTYAYQTAELLNADASIVSYSGYGIITGYVGRADAARAEAQRVPDVYECLGFSYGAFQGAYSKDILWDFPAARAPDVIVVNLGTNDTSYLQYHEDEIGDFVTAYEAFLERLRVLNPQAKILCTLGIMGDQLYPQVEEAVALYQANTGDQNVYTMKFDVQSAADGYAADWHPTYATHTKAAQKLAEYIEELNH